MLTNRTLNSTLDRMLTLNRALDQALATNWADASFALSLKAIGRVKDSCTTPSSRRSP